MTSRARARPRFFAPEVVQTSAMDCGPASLKCLLEGFGISVSYGRLREACQSDVDGTSIDVMEEVANQLGLRADQTMVPLDHLLLAEAEVLPAIVIVRLPDGNTHFVVVWRRIGDFVQVMDPATGRRWMRAAALREIAFVHAMPVPAVAWREWAGSAEFLGCLRHRCRAVGVAGELARLIERAEKDPTWRSLSALDAATRMVDALVRAKAIDGGRAAERLLETSFETALAELDDGTAETSIPARYWSAGPVPRAAGETAASEPRDDEPPSEEEEQVLLRGAVAVKVRQGTGDAPAEGEASAVPLSPELAAALTEPPARPLRDLVGLLRADGVLTPAIVLGAVVVSTTGAGLEALLLRGLLDIGRRFATWDQRVAALVALVVFLVCLLGVEVSLVSSTLAMGRRLEARLRMAFLAKIPLLGDRYFHSRPTSDMTHRAHAIHVVRQLPALGLRLVRSVAELAATTAGLAWLDPKSLPLVASAAVLSIAIPLATQASLVERDLRLRAYQGALSRFYLDALLGLIAIRTHGADRAVRREHETTVGHFKRASVELLARSVTVDALDAIVGTVVAVWLLFHYLAAGRDPSAALVLIYWALNVPVIGSDIAQSMRQYPAYRNLTLRLLEPLGALEDIEPASELAPGPVSRTSAASGTRGRGVELELASVSVRAAGKTILEEIDLTIAPGSHVAIVGPSGAGKSSLVSLLLGWHRAAEGEVRVDGAPLRGERLDRLRLETAWVDPAIQLWNRSLLENLEYGVPPESGALSFVLSSADVVRILERLPEGLASSLGDGGALVSGGEGQRVRLARAMLRGKSRLVILDEPFRGLDREARHLLLARARALWADATLLCVTHDVGDTLEFPRVLVVDGGRICEDGPPRELAADAGSRYRALLDTEQMVQRGMWLDPSWRRIDLREGRLHEAGGGVIHEPSGGGE